MGRKRVERTPEEEVQFQEQKRVRHNENQKKRRSANRARAQKMNSQLLDPISEDVEHYLGLMNVLCQHCNALHFVGEKVTGKGISFNDCCSHGEAELDPLPDFPEYIKFLLNGNHEHSKDFFSRIRMYNNSFSFASFNANLINFNSNRQGPFCFKIQGQIYYQVNTTLYPVNDESPAFGQLFIYDPQEALEYRLQNNMDLNRNILETLDNFYRSHNIFAKSYEMMHNEIQKLRNNLPNELSAENHEPELQLLFTLKPGMDKRRYNFQQTNEVAAIFKTSADGDIPESYVTIRNKITKQLQNVSSMDPNVEPWIYPIFYPYGTIGWHKDLKRKSSQRRISRAAYTKHRMAVRSSIFNPFILGRRLFQQWVVDSYVKIEKDRITWCQQHQKELRVDSYKGLIDYLQNVAEDFDGQVGKAVVLPSTFIGSPRNMLQSYQDAMGIVRRFGTPDLFITMTCNPNWREIRENLLAGQQPSDRPDICTRVFNLKKEHLLHLIVKKSFFGTVAAHVHVIEFQKRGLPHCHLLITLNKFSKFSTPGIVDKYISAEIPNKEIDPVLYKIVMKNMIHGPCGSWCLVDGKCSKRFPKNFQNETTLDGDGYPTYKRRDTKELHQHSSNYHVNNSFVVPYNPDLLKIFNCHINVESVASIKSVKYLFKYIYKGHDSAGMVVQGDDTVIYHDEIKDYIDNRYVGPAEACYRILGKSLQNKSHTVIRLPVHLPGENNVTITYDMLASLELTGHENNESSVDNTSFQRSMLMDYFCLNTREPDARKYLYPDIPMHYVWKKVVVDEEGNKAFRWMERSKHPNTIGRMYSVSPSQLELYYLRCLLLHVKGAESFDDLMTVDGTKYQTFFEVCIHLGLLEDDSEWRRALEEGKSWMMPNQLRRLFVRILVHCHPSEPEILWEEFKEALSQDLIRHHGLDEGLRLAYAQIVLMLNQEGRSIADFPNMDQISIENNELLDELPLREISRLGTQHYNKLNEQQKVIVDTVLSAVHGDCPLNCFYVDGPGGSGKTFIYMTIYYLLTCQNKKVCSMAFTGIAATLLPKGKTVHKTLGLPVPLLPHCVQVLPFLPEPVPIPT